MLNLNSCSNLIKKRFNCDISEQAAKKMFSDGYLSNFGVKEDLTDLIDDLKQSYIILTLE